MLTIIYIYIYIYAHTYTHIYMNTSVQHVAYLSDEVSEVQGVGHKRHPREQVRDAQYHNATRHVHDR